MTKFDPASHLQIHSGVDMLGCPERGGRMSIIERNNVVVSGNGEKTIIFSHGFGCDQNMWRFVAPEFEDNFRIVLFCPTSAPMRQNWFN